MFVKRIVTGACSYTENVINASTYTCIDPSTSIDVPTYSDPSMGTEIGGMGKRTALGVKAATAPGRYQDGNGLMLVVKESGARSWLLRVQAGGKRRDFGWGSLSSTGLAEARHKADELRKQYRSRIDPVEAKLAARAASDTIPVFAEAALAAFDEQKLAWRN